MRQITRVIGNGIATFAVIFISSALMALIGQPVLDQLPGGSWGIDMLRDTGNWLVSPPGLFWIVAALTSVFVYWIVRFAPVTKATTLNVALCLSGGVIAGSVFRLTDTGSLIVNPWSDLALWMLIGSYLAPLAAALLWWNLPEVVADIRVRARAKRDSHAGVLRGTRNSTGTRAKTAG